MKFYSAPLQGLSESIWRNTHESLFGGIDAYYTPFIRLEKNTLRHKDLREISPENNAVEHLVPQIIASNAETMRTLVSHIASFGYSEININMGCPFPPIARKHQGAGILPFPKEVADLAKEIGKHPEIRFSVKMRLGMNASNEWKAVLPILNDTAITHIVLHPRIGKQQYEGEIDMNACTEFFNACKHPFIYNGDVKSIDDIKQIEQRFPESEGIMVGRGLISSPNLINDYLSGKISTKQQDKEAVRKLHQTLYSRFCETLEGGEKQILDKLKPYWEYFLPNMDRKARKGILKATKMDK